MLKLHGYIGRIRVIGWDKSPAAVDTTRFVLAWEKRAWTPDQVEVEITKHDSLMVERWPEDVDILIMNPPFKAWGLMTAEEKEIVTQILGSSNKPNLAMAFASRAVKVLRESGTLAMIVPNSLLEASSGRDVRKAIAEILTPQLIARLGDQSIFSRALVDAGMYVGKRDPVTSIPTAILWADSRSTSLNLALRGLRRWRGAEIQPIKDEGFSVYHRRDIGRSGEPWMAREYDSWRSYEKVRKIKWLVPAKEIFDIKQGVRLGNDVFIISRDYFDKLRKSERQFFRPAIMNFSISDGKVNDNYYVFYPYSDDRLAIATEEELEERVPTYFKEFLLPAKPKLVSRKSLAESNLKWWDLIRHRSWQEEHIPKIVSKYFGRVRSFAFDQSGQFVVVVGHAWLLRKGTVATDITDEEIYSAVLAYLNSTIADNLLQYLSIQVSGGQYDLSNKYVRNLPIPNLAALEPSKVSALVEMGARISAGSVDRWADVDELIESILTE